MKAENPIIEAIKKRRSIRQFAREPVSDEDLNRILESGLWALSGKNNQPWKFPVIRDPNLRGSLPTFTHYSSIIENAPVCIAVFSDHLRVYDRTKDVQAVGASIQNMLLTIHTMELGGVWLGEILKYKEQVGELLRVDKDLEWMAVVALGHPNGRALGSAIRDKPGKRDRLGERVFLRK